jgi:murein DD-endopeptidase MepM/ murein hydrolase activator NlpD
VDLPACSSLRLAAALRPVAIAAFALAALLPGTALAQTPAGTGGAAPTQTPVAAAAASAAAPRPVIDAITCRTGCLGISRATPGSAVRVSGEGMATVASVILLGRRGYRDDVTVPATPVTPTAVEVTLPPNAHGGPVRVLSATGKRSLQSKTRLVIRPTGTHDPGGPVVEAKVLTRKLLFTGGRTATVSFYVRGAAPVDVAVDVVRASDRTAVAHFAVPGVAPGSVQSVDWDGTIAGVAQPDGRYVFQVAAAIGGGVGARAAQVSAPAPRRESFWLVHDVFPIVGPHTYGQGFGVQRTGHTHEGQDVMADCGLPLVATQSGTVKFAGTQALAGNYVVISAADGSADYVYMHLRDPALVKKGAPVVTGQPIGFVGRTGDATACHLHFEMWPAPGWYTGGSPVDPLPSLKSWDVAA